MAKAYTRQLERQVEVLGAERVRAWRSQLDGLSLGYGLDPADALIKRVMYGAGAKRYGFLDWNVAYGGDYFQDGEDGPRYKLTRPAIPSSWMPLVGGPPPDPYGNYDGYRDLKTEHYDDVLMLYVSAIAEAVAAGNKA